MNGKSWKFLTEKFFQNRLREKKVLIIMIISIRRFDEDPVTTIKCFSVFLKREETALLRKVKQRREIFQEKITSLAVHWHPGTRLT